jgi:probable HAF family extracellular repeat protein
MSVPVGFLICDHGITMAKLALSGPGCCTAREEGSACERALSDHEYDDRSTKAFGRTRLSLAAFLGALCVALTVAARPAAAEDWARSPVLRYKLTLLGDLDPVNTFAATDLNNRGQVTGYLSGGPGYRGAVWQRGRITVLPATGKEATFANAVNDFGDVGGGDLVNNINRPVIWHKGELIELDAPDGLDTQVFRINNRGDALGFYHLWTRGTFTRLQGTPSVSLGMLASDLNNRGEVVGWGSTDELDERALLWRDGTVEVLDNLPGLRSSRAISLNDFGQVVGFSFDGGPQHAFLWKDGQTRPLRHLYDDADETSEVHDINNWGQIVGQETHLGVPIAILWQFGRAHDLNQLIRKGDPLQHYVTLQWATRINDWGQIVAAGIDSRYPYGNLQWFWYLLTPVLPR